MSVYMYTHVYVSYGCVFAYSYMLYVCIYRYILNCVTISCSLGFGRRRIPLNPKVQDGPRVEPTTRKKARSMMRWRVGLVQVKPQR